jgi:hypothetical protein
MTHAAKGLHLTYTCKAGFLKAIMKRSSSPLHLYLCIDLWCFLVNSLNLLFTWSIFAGKKNSLSSLALVDLNNSANVHVENDL